MSYILDALRKSEAERRQGKAPDLGQPVQMVYRPKRKPVSAVVWVALALLVNAGVLAWLFWPERDAKIVTVQEAPAVAQEQSEPVPDVPAAQPEPEPIPETEIADPVRVSGGQDLSQAKGTDVVTEAGDDAMSDESGVNQQSWDEPVVIVPSRSESEPLPQSALTERVPQGRVPHLVELPLSFQKSVPDLTFNSHIFASDPSASRVMINGHYLKPGDGFGPLLVERITEDGVVLSKNGQFFRVGTVRDWVSPR
ncbi:general secretion pathway protein GspB [Marinobacter hydrocarbonoclasticus]|uniref:general secretion pathway protein GspB n=1 Tax=Marinobacter nauticus TaxID=2743 RepID=UPI001A8FBEB1|nr:general secretion pathway protein GspB [Marinobacter nauticus]MBN8238117.1 general secretion pathway protein GspB [Marinobacter nauticus]